MINYESCVTRAKRVAWDLNLVKNELEIDFNKLFIPHKIAIGQEKPRFLKEKQLLILNQIRASSYAHLFLFVEEFIIELMLQQSGGVLHLNANALQSLLIFAEEEIKHQTLFEYVKTEINKKLTCDYIPDKEKVAKSICQYPNISVLLLTSMIEWMTQVHYVCLFRDKIEQKDFNFSKVFRYHWMEEAQHTQIDYLEIQRSCQNMDEDTVDKNYTAFIDLLYSLKELVEKQSLLDYQSFLENTKVKLSSEESNELQEILRDAFNWSFLQCGLKHQKFSNLIQEFFPKRYSEFNELNLL